MLENFNEMVNNFELIDAGSSGNKFTWRRSQRDGRCIKERLDRFLTNVDFLNKMDGLVVEHLGFHNSDHKIIVASWRDKGLRARPKRWRKRPRFEAHWAKFEECSDIVKYSWSTIPMGDISRFNDKMVSCLSNLAEWDKARLKGSIRGAISRNMDQLQELEKGGFGGSK